MASVRNRIVVSALSMSMVAFAGWKERDPLLRLRAYLEARGILGDGVEDGIREEVAAEIATAAGLSERAVEGRLRRARQRLRRELESLLGIKGED